MRVITGTARGAKLTAPEGYETRPTTEKVKEALFSAIQFDIEGRRVLDLFAGSGQLGIEALSRGAESAVFIDNGNNAVEIIKRNLKSAKLEQKATVFKTDYTMFLQSTDLTFDIVFLDPPYKANQMINAINTVNNRLSDYGMIICEHSTNEKLPEEIQNLSIFKTYKYGKTGITVYKRKKD